MFQGRRCLPKVQVAQVVPEVQVVVEEVAAVVGVAGLATSHSPLLRTLW